MNNHKYCPECGAETIVETITDPVGSFKQRRCTGLISDDDNSPLYACEWSEYVGDRKYNSLGAGITTITDKNIQL